MILQTLPLFFAFFFFPLQMEYVLSQTTQKEFDGLLEMHSGYYDIVREMPRLLVIAENNTRTNTYSVQITDEIWSKLNEKVSGLSKKIHYDIAEKCKVNMRSNLISQTSSDRKFWQQLYSIHFRLSR